jgi:hypothetical protein
LEARRFTLADARHLWIIFLHLSSGSAILEPTELMRVVARKVKGELADAIQQVPRGLPAFFNAWVYFSLPSWVNQP